MDLPSGYLLRRTDTREMKAEATKNSVNAESEITKNLDTRPETKHLIELGRKEGMINQDKAKNRFIVKNVEKNH